MRVLMLVLAAVALGACDGRGRSARSDTSAISPRGGDTGSGAAAASPAPPTAARPAVLLVGTSLTAGYGLDDPARDAYPAVLQRKADSAGRGVEIVNAGLSGETSAGALRRVDWLLDRYAARAKVVVIESGANDGLRGIDPDSTEANLARIVRTVKQRVPSATVLLVQMEAPPNMGQGFTRRFHDMYPRVAKAEGVELLPFLLDGVAGKAALNQADGIHPTVEGARRVAANLWPALEGAVRRSGALDPRRRVP